MVVTSTHGDTLEFLRELRDQVRQNNFLQGPHPFTTMMLAGELTQGEMQEWAKQFYIRTQAFSRGVAYMFAKCPDRPTRQEIAENLYEEETGALSGTKPHVDLFGETAISLGVGQGELDTVKPTPYTQAFVDYIESLSTKTFGEVAAAMAIGSEAQAADGVQRLSTALGEHYGAETRFFDLHVELDADHAEVGDEVIAEYATTAEERERMSQALETHLEQYRMWLDGLYAAEVEPRLSPR